MSDTEKWKVNDGGSRWKQTKTLALGKVLLNVLMSLSNSFFLQDLPEMFSPHTAVHTDVVLVPRARPSAPDPPNQAPIPYNCVSDHSSVRQYLCVCEWERENEDTFRDAQQELMQEQMFKILFQSNTHIHIHTGKLKW